jgi:hypothetical protein
MEPPRKGEFTAGVKFRLDAGVTKFPWLAKAVWTIGTHPMTISEPSSRQARPPAVQPWAVGLIGVVAILILLVGFTI